MFYTASSGCPAGELNDRVVTVGETVNEAKQKLENELQEMGWLEESESWIWSGAGSQSFTSEKEAVDFANYRMGVEE